MKKGIHPQYFDHTTISCSCGASFVVGATKENITIETCSQCHPFYTGKKRIVDSTGRVDRFKKLSEKAVQQKAARKDVKTKDQKRKEKEEKISDKS